MANVTLNYQAAPGHQVLAAAGKKILRPGGRAATEQLFQWADFKAGETVLELASSFGESAIALAKRFDTRVVGVEKNPDSVARAQANIQAAGLADQVQIIEGDIFHLEQVPEKFDYVLAEAILTMQSLPGKAKILRAIHKHLKPGGKFLSHELLARNNQAQIHHDLAAAIRVNATPLSAANWMAECEAAGFSIYEHCTGEMGLLKLEQLLRDEGVVGTAQIGWNILRNPAIRRRVLEMGRVFHQHRQDLGYIALCAIAQPTQS